jgi:hypothetical protein
VNISWAPPASVSPLRSWLPLPCSHSIHFLGVNLSARTKEKPKRHTSADRCRSLYRACSRARPCHLRPVRHYCSDPSATTHPSSVASLSALTCFSTLHGLLRLTIVLARHQGHRISNPARHHIDLPLRPGRVNCRSRCRVDRIRQKPSINLKRRFYFPLGAVWRIRPHSLA